MTSTNNSDPLLPEKVSRFYKRIFGETLIGKKPQNKPESGGGDKKTTTSTSASSASPAPSPSDPANSSRERKYGASEASEKSPVAAEVLKKVKTVDAVTHEGASKVDFLFLYFSASWCPPCRHFAPQLASVYDKVNKRHVLSVLERADFEAAVAFATATDDIPDSSPTEAEDADPSAQPAPATAGAANNTASTTISLPSAPPIKPKMEGIFVSGDTTFEDAEKYFVEKQGDWLMIPFEEIKVRERLIQRYEVTAYPTLIILDAKTGKVVTKKAVAEIRGDLDGEQFPWRPDSIVEKLAKEVEIRKRIVAKKDNSTKSMMLPFATPLVSSATTTTTTPSTTTSSTDESKNFKKIDIKKLKHFALYFASQTSAPCRAFTPLLAAVYEDHIRKMFSEDETEIIFVSMDTENETHYETMRSQMPWAAVSQNHPIIPYLVKTLGVDSLPKLVTISVSDGGKILNSEGRAAVAEEAESFDPNDPSSSASESDASDIDDDGNTDTTTNDTKNKTTNKNKKKKVKCGYPWARTKLPLVAPLVASNEVLTAIKSVPCVVLATNRASNTRVLATEFKAAVALYDRGGTALLASKGLSLTTFNSRSTSSIFAELGFDTSSSQSGGGTGLSTVSPIYDMPSPDEDPSHALDTYDPERGTGGMGYNESDKKRVQFFVADENHVGSEQLLHRLTMLLHENLPPSGIACVFSFDLRENKSGGMLKSIQTRDIVEYTERFVKECEAAAAASPAKNLASLEPAQQGSRRRPNQQQQQQQQGENTNSAAPNNPPSSQQQRPAPESIAQPAQPGDC